MDVNKYMFTSLPYAVKLNHFLFLNLHNHIKFYRMTRNAMSSLPNEMSLQDFNWAMVLAGDPEQKFRKEKEKQSPKTDIEYSPR